jgi:hypothetical protein
MVLDAVPGPAAVLGICDLGDWFGWVLNGVDVVEADEPLPKLPVAEAVRERKLDVAIWRSRGPLQAAPEPGTSQATALSRHVCDDRSLSPHLRSLSRVARPRRRSGQLSRWDSTRRLGRVPPPWWDQLTTRTWSGRFDRLTTQRDQGCQEALLGATRPRRGQGLSGVQLRGGLRSFTA